MAITCRSRCSVTYARKDMSEINTVDLHHQVGPVTASVRNMLDEQYEQPDGYNQTGRTFEISYKVRFLNVDSPCHKHMRTRRNSICTGCGRTVEQIQQWTRYTDQQRAEIIKSLRLNPPPRQTS